MSPTRSERRAASAVMMRAQTTGATSKTGPKPGMKVLSGKPGRSGVTTRVGAPTSKRLSVPGGDDAGHLHLLGEPRKAVRLFEKGERREQFSAREAAARALLRSAEERLMRIEEMRDAALLAAQDKTQREIAEVMKTTQPRVGRMLRAMQGRDLSVPTPQEIILLATAGRLRRAEMLRMLASAHYTFGERAPEPFDGRTSGSWDEVVDAYSEGLLDEEEFARVSEAARRPR